MLGRINKCTFLRAAAIRFVGKIQLIELGQRVWDPERVSVEMVDKQNGICHQCEVTKKINEVLI